ncbi:hypothetical protein PybrP1_010719 [[Pythium] brassicae (nom. inval.)]|nr:hypothetical protein PybrP1_010719 [[Pythium] brassicae (nom. inval.)]
MPSTHRFSHAVSRLFRALHKKPRASGDAPKLLAPESLALTSTALPAAFFKLVRSLLERAETLQKADDARCSTGSSTTRSSLWSLASPEANPRSSVSSSKRHHKDGAASEPASDCYARLTTLLATTASSSSSSSVAVPVAVETLLDLWDVLLQLLQSDEPVDAGAAAASTRQSALALLRAIVTRHEFDVALNAVASGACSCSAHRSPSGVDTARSSHKRRASSVRLERAGSFRVVPAASVAASAPAKKASRRSLLHKAKRSGSRANGASSSSNAGAALCTLVRRYLSLHQLTLQLIEDAVMAAAAAATTTVGKQAALLAAMTQTHELLAALVAASYLRVPFLREKMTAKLALEAATASRRSATRVPTAPTAPVVAESDADTTAESPLPLFQWPQRLAAKCSACIAPLSRDEYWFPNVRFIETVLADADARLVLFASLVQHVTAAGGAWGRVDWPRVPGFPVLVKLLLSSTASLLQRQQQALEAALPSSDDDAMERASVKGSAAAKLQPLEASASGPDALFFSAALTFVGENPSLLPALLLAVFTSTNALLPHHVALCLEYLERLVAAFPRFFRDEPPSDASLSPLSPSPVVDVALLERVFACLLASEHFEILKAAELCLLRTFGAFSQTLRAALTRVLAAQFQRLFLHWHRDVRYCYFHALLYLSYAGNRIVLCARSDASVLGAEAAQLFEIPGLVRTPAMAAWDVFDAPLHALLARYSRATRPLKATGAARGSLVAAAAARPSTASPASASAPSWVDDVSFTELARSVPEYRRLVLTYFQSAKQLSLHEPVPVPVFYVKGSAAPHS